MEMSHGHGPVVHAAPLRGFASPPANFSDPCRDPGIRRDGPDSPRFSFTMSLKSRSGTAFSGANRRANNSLRLPAAGEGDGITGASSPRASARPSRSSRSSREALGGSRRCSARSISKASELMPRESLSALALSTLRKPGPWSSRRPRRCLCKSKEPHAVGEKSLLFTAPRTAHLFERLRSDRPAITDPQQRFPTSPGRAARRVGTRCARP